MFFWTGHLEGYFCRCGAPQMKSPALTSHISLLIAQDDDV